jgi:hypothetical protein
MFRFVSLLVVFLVSLTGCIFSPLIQGYKDLGVSESDRMQLLPLNMKKFQDALYWGDPTEALNYVVDDSKMTMQPELNKLRKKTMRIVDSRVDSVDWASEAREATVKVAMQYYAVPVYIVKERTDEQHWVFEATGGWKIKSTKTIEEANATGAG